MLTSLSLCLSDCGSPPPTPSNLSSLGCLLFLQLFWTVPNPSYICKESA